ncbi:MAG: MxaD family protein [Opitutaceae bacterium]|nr:MxaD family protein [Opitutaceae bacterium]|tara:strand:- start:604 stop:1044 length:441 start_codon:yes stop_codon:yes gene_type:complete
MVNATYSTVIDACIEDVWDTIRDFNGLPTWHPRIAKSEIEDGMSPDQVGCVRKFELANGAVLREKLLELSDQDHCVSYTILETPQPISNHRATLQLMRVIDGDRTFAQWSASFDTSVDDADALGAGMSENVFKGGLHALQKHFSEK